MRRPWSGLDRTTTVLATVSATGGAGALRCYEGSPSVTGGEMSGRWANRTSARGSSLLRAVGGGNRRLPGGGRRRPLTPAGGRRARRGRRRAGGGHRGPSWGTRGRRSGSGRGGGEGGVEFRLHLVVERGGFLVDRGEPETAADEVLDLGVGGEPEPGLGEVLHRFGEPEDVFLAEVARLDLRRGLERHPVELEEAGNSVLVADPGDLVEPGGEGGVGQVSFLPGEGLGPDLLVAHHDDVLEEGHRDVPGVALDDPRRVELAGAAARQQLQLDELVARVVVLDGEDDAFLFVAADVPDDLLVFGFPGGVRHEGRVEVEDGEPGEVPFDPDAFDFLDPLLLVR